MYTISLQNLEFYAYHGYYQEENLIGTNFIVDIHVKIEDKQLNNGELSQTVNYEIIFNIVKLRMNIKYKLLEQFVKDVHDDILSNFKFAKSIEVIIRKKKVPINGMIGESVVKYHKEY